MSLNPEFRPLDWFYKNENVPLSAPDLPLSLANTEPGTLVLPNESRIPTFEPTKEKPGFFQSIANAFTDYNEFSQLGRYIQSELVQGDPNNDPVPDGWTPMNLEFLKQYPNDYWWYLAQAESPGEQQARGQWVSQEMQRRKDLEDGSFAGNLIGGLAGAVLSPTSLLPFAALSKGSTVAQTVLKNTLTAAPYVGAQTLAHEAWTQATSASDNLEELAVNTLRDTAFGTAFVGLGAGLGQGLRGGQLWATRKAASYAYEGVDFHTVIKDGEVTGIKAVPSRNVASSADVVEQAQQFADSAMKQGFIFSIPMITKLAGNKFLGSPIVAAKTNRFKTLGGAIDRLASHSIIDESIDKGIARPDSAEDILSSYSAGATKFGANHKALFFDQNGIGTEYNFRNATKSFMQAANKNQQMSYDDFNRTVVKAILDKDYTHSRQINEAAKQYTDYTDTIYKTWRDLMGLDETFTSPKGAVGYYMQNANVTQLVKRSDEFVRLAALEFQRLDTIIERESAPLNAAMERLRQLEEFKLTGEGNNRSLVNEIEREKARIRAERRRIEELVRSDNPEHEDIKYILEDANHLTLEESDRLREILKPSKDMERELTKRRAALQKEKKKLSGFKSKAKSNKTDEATAKNLNAMAEQEKVISFLEAEIDRMAVELDNLKFELEAGARDGTIPRKFFTRAENVIKFRDPEELNLFRKPFGSQAEREAAAEQLRQKYLNYTPEQMQDAILATASPSLFASPLMQRTTLLPSRWYLDNNFLETDVATNAAVYSRVFGKRIALETAMKDVNIQAGETGFMGLARVLAEERAAQQAEVDKIKDPAKREKERLKLANDFDKARDMLEAMAKNYNGDIDGSKSIRRFARNVRSFSAATKLLGVPIAQMTDTAAIAMKFGLWNTFRDGIRPMIKTLNGYLDGKLSEEVKRNAADVNLALQHLENAYSKHFMGGESVRDVPTPLYIENVLQGVAHVSGNLAGTNLIENFHERLAATTIQSKFMRNMYEYVEGTLSKSDLEGLLLYGLDPKEWAQRFIKAFENNGGWKDGQSYFTRFYDWQDAEAAARMSMSIRRGVNDAVVKRGLFTSPYWINNPILGMIFMFHGWGFAAFNRYTVPMMQRMDAQKFLGIAMMLSIGAWSDPLRKIANGRPADVDNDDTWFAKAFETVSNSGVLGHLPEFLQVANKLVDGAALPKMTERYRDWNKLSVLGPAAGILGDISEVLHAALTGKVSKQTIKKLIRLIPLTGHLAWRGLLSKYVDSLNLPDKRSEAEGYAWRQ